MVLRREVAVLAALSRLLQAAPFAHRLVTPGILLPRHRRLTGAGGRSRVSSVRDQSARAECTDRRLIYSRRHPPWAVLASARPVTTGYWPHQSRLQRPHDQGNQASAPPTLPVQRAKVPGGVINEYFWAVLTGAGQRGLLGSPALDTGSPAARQAWKPPIRSVALGSPSACRDAAASEEEYPWSQQIIQVTW
jgi:hypothetical protein